jgi:flagellar motility protein MotE (MotC chaperone)
MIRLLREFRLIPIVLIATGCLFALKIFGLMLDGGYLFGARSFKNDGVVTLSLKSNAQTLTPQTVTLDGRAASPDGRSSWMGEIFGYPGDVTGSIKPNSGPPKNTSDITGSAAASKPASNPPPTDKNGMPVAPPSIAPPVDKNSIPRPPPPTPMGTQIPLDQQRSMSPSERAILERLHERRQQLDARARELDIRESLLKEAEKKLDARSSEIKDIEGKANVGLQKKEEAEQSRFKNLGTMYENMKPKDAAKIFDRLDLKVLIDMTSQINPRRMSEILAQMSPESAERLTMELAARAGGGEKTVNPSALPKIEGRPNGS